MIDYPGMESFVEIHDVMVLGLSIPWLVDLDWNGTFTAFTMSVFRLQKTVYHACIDRSRL